MALEYTSWWPASSWISPGAALFLLCNALVGAIVVTSSRGVHAEALPQRLVHDDYHLELEKQPQPAVAEPATPTAPASAPAAAEEVAEVGEEEAVISEEAQDPARQGHALESSLSPAVVTGDTETEATAAAERPATVVGTIVQCAQACRRELVEEALEGKAALNARAELFIRQFREDLKLQRLNSIINYTCALRRGAGGTPPAAAEQ
ncbi:unnamed protein product [Urochloa decumbens]|uniref:DUF4408 domain-containing protein n=1 Tax=Urochloa decumbens TaxID=240449 RepID=A0ABC9BMR3_9POAL